jgi:hypothetical protein
MVLTIGPVTIPEAEAPINKSALTKTWAIVPGFLFLFLRAAIFSFSGVKLSRPKAKIQLLPFRLRR